MSLVVSDQGISWQLEALRAAYNVAALKLHLFKSNTTPSKSTVLSDFVEADFDGYSSVTIATWSAPAVAAHVATTSPTAITFAKSAGATTNNVYGYYVTDSAGTTLLWSERDPAAPTGMASTGDSYTVTLSDSNESKYG